MDSPWGWGYDELCVYDGITSTVTLTGTLHSSVDVLRVVAWWYDARHDDTTPVDHDEVEMRLQLGAGISVSATTDNRQRIHRTTGLAGNTAVLKLEGTNVTSDYAGCGVNGIPVTYAWFYESSAHNDTSLDADGVNPLDYIREEQ